MPAKGPGQPARLRKHGILYTVLWGWPWALAGMVLGAFLLNLLMAFVGMVLIWPGQGSIHSQRILLTESGWLSTKLTRSPLSGELAVTITTWGRRVYLWAEVGTGVMALPDALHRELSRGHGIISRRMNPWLESLAGELDVYLRVTLCSIGVMLVRLGILLLSAPLFGLVATVAVVEGLSRRDLRRYGAAYESSFIYHHARRLIKPALRVPCLLYLIWPTTADPDLFLLPAVVLFGCAVTVALASFKKYL